MSILFSAVMTAIVLSPVFVLAGWVKAPQALTMRARFNRATTPR